MCNYRIILVFILMAQLNLTKAQSDLWQALELEQNTSKQLLEDYSAFSTYQLDESALWAILENAPEEYEQGKDVLELSFPVGEYMQKFEVVHSSVMEEGLQKKFPMLRTYLIKGADGSYINGRISIGPNGLKMYVRGFENSYFIDRVDKNKKGAYVSYAKKDVLPKGKFTCHVVDGEHVHSPVDLSQAKSGRFGEELRTYRMAVATTGEYSIFHGNTAETVMAAIMASVNRLNVLFEQDIAVRFVLVSNNDLLINYDPTTDPFNDGSANQMLNANPSFINSRIGIGSYDIGHVFATGGAGLASLASVCANDKARGVTGISPPEGNTFDIEYLAHEIGHQFGATHSFNFCDGINESSTTAYEPGSGTTVMSYAGLCGPNNVASAASDYFHVGSLVQMDNFINAIGENCADITPTGNNRAEVSVPDGDFFIPFGTPFELVADGSDPDGHPLSYCWEQFDRGPESTYGSPQGNAPSFRSFLPVNSPSRVFPKLNNILDNNFNNSEVMSNGARAYNFVATVRDNQAGGGSAAWERIQFRSSGIAGPFVVTSQNDPDEEWLTNNEATVTWDVANTDGNEVNCQSVNIYLSKNLGFTFDVLLAEGVPNTGSATFIVPDGAESNFARVKVEAADNIFFNINMEEFKVSTGVVSTQEIGSSDLIRVFPNPVDDQFTLDVSAFDLKEEIQAELYAVNGQILIQKDLNSSQEAFDVSLLPQGVYFLKVNTAGKVYTKRLILK